MSAGGLAGVRDADTVGVDRGLFVYGVVPADADPPTALTGLDDGAVELVRAGRVAAAVCWIDLERPSGHRADLLGYHAVLDALSEAGPVAPVRFGSVLPDVAAVMDFLHPQEEGFVQLLAELQGRWQFNLRATYLEDVVLSELVADDPEIRELRERTRGLPEDASYVDRVRLGELVARELEGRSARDAELLMDVVLSHTAGHVLRSAPGAVQVLDVALLVDASHSEEFERALEELAEAVHERIRMRLVGPMAPYDFTGGG